jgi:hypothetical protein
VSGRRTIGVVTNLFERACFANSSRRRILCFPGLVVGVVSARLADIEMLNASGSLPQNVNFAIRGDLAQRFLRANGVKPLVAEPKSPLSASEIASNAQAYTVQVVCQLSQSGN